MNLHKFVLALPASLALAGCVTVPQGPTVAVMPGAGKSLAQFQGDAAGCQQFARDTVSGAGQTAQDNAAANAVGGAAVGAAVGAILGSVTGQAGAGAAWGAGTGLLFGSAAGSNAAGASSYTLQRQFDVAYMQCMYAHGNQVPARVAQRTVRTYSAPPPAGYGAPPAGYGTPPGRYSVPPNAAVPPPNTPPPSGLLAPGGSP